MLERIAEHFLHRLVGNLHRTLDVDHRVTPCGRVASEHMQDAIRVEFELHAQAGLPLRRRRKCDLHRAERPVIAGHLTLALKDCDFHPGLVRDSVGKHFAGLAGNGRISRNDDIHQTAECFDSQRERGDIEQGEILNRPFENSRLNHGAEGDRLIRMLAGVGFPSENPGYKSSDHGHPSRASHENDRIQIRRLQPRISERAQAMRACACEERSTHRLQRGPGVGFS